MAKLTLAYPVSPPRVNQGWGVNGAYYQANGVNIKGHNGIDYGTYHGQPIYASHSGHAYYQIDDRGGHGVVIISDKAYDYKNGTTHFKTIYWHLCDPVAEPKYASPIYGKSGVPVKTGDIIGYADNTGLSTGDHLHFALKPVRRSSIPLDVEEVYNWLNTESNNGYTGCIDPGPYFGRISDTTVSYEQALVNLMGSGLTGIVLSMAQAILKAKYRR